MLHPVIGIRREDKNEWERRVPLAPRHVKDMVSKGFAVHIQPSEIRVFKDSEYVEAGASVQEDLSEAKIVYGVKEFPVDFIKPNQAGMFFAHVIKGQKYNMPMLKAILERNYTLIDYEKITNDRNQRLVFFGNYAGLAGMLETLYTYGRRLEWEGYDTPFLALKRPLEYGSLEEAKAALYVVGRWISIMGLPPGMGPMIVGFAGYGNVSKGAQSIMDVLPVEEIAPSELEDFIREGDFSPHLIYKVVFYEKDMVEPIDPEGHFELQDYFKHPEKYRGVFEQYLDKLGILVNCIYWDARYPRLITKKWVRENWSRKSMLKVIGDITCDIEGSVEITLKGTEPGNPVYVYNAEKDTKEWGWEGNGPVVMSVDTLPSELPRESSIFFGGQLMPFAQSIGKADFNADFAELDLPPEIKKAVITHKGKLTPNYEYLSQHLEG